MRAAIDSHKYTETLALHLNSYMIEIEEDKNLYCVVLFVLPSGWHTINVHIPQG